MKKIERKRFRIERNNRIIFVVVEKRRVKLIKFMQAWRRNNKYIFVIQKRIQFRIIRFEFENAFFKKRYNRFEKWLTKTKQKRNQIWTKINKLTTQFEKTNESNDNNNNNDNDFDENAFWNDFENDVTIANVVIENDWMSNNNSSKNTKNIEFNLKISTFKFDID